VTTMEEIEIMTAQEVADTLAANPPKPFCQCTEPMPFALCCQTVVLSSPKPKKRKKGKRK